MTPTARLGGLTLSVLLHAGAILALLSWSGSEWAHPLFVDLLERSESASGPAVAGEPAEPARRVAAPSGRTSRDDGGARRRAPAPSRPATPPPEAVAPDPAPPPPMAATPPPPAPVPAPETPRPAAASGESAPVPAASTAASASVARPESAGSSGGSRQTDAAGGEATPGAAGSGGSPLARTAPGGGGGDVPGEYGPYLARFRQRVQEALVYPLAARRQGAQGTVELDVWIEASGRVRDVRVVRSSTNPLLDEAALETIRRLGLVPFPESLPRRPLLIRLPLVFELR
ncbi:MAG TPA: energy transducer TonB [Methylomirabilota bacterium]|jgi:protein TonB